jgi:hypothetical protein
MQARRSCLGRASAGGEQSGPDGGVTFEALLQDVGLVGRD